MEIDFLRKQIRDTFDRMNANEASTCNLIKISEWISLRFINNAQGDELADYNTAMFKKYQ